MSRIRLLDQRDPVPLPTDRDLTYTHPDELARGFRIDVRRGNTRGGYGGTLTLLVVMFVLFMLALSAGSLVLGGICLVATLVFGFTLIFGDRSRPRPSDSYLLLDDVGIWAMAETEMCLCPWEALNPDLPARFVEGGVVFTPNNAWPHPLTNWISMAGSHITYGCSITADEQNIRIAGNFIGVTRSQFVSALEALRQITPPPPPALPKGADLPVRQAFAPLPRIPADLPATHFRLDQSKAAFHHLAPHRRLMVRGILAYNRLRRKPDITFALLDQPYSQPLASIEPPLAQWLEPYLQPTRDAGFTDHFCHWSLPAEFQTLSILMRHHQHPVIGVVSLNTEVGANGNIVIGYSLVSRRLDDAYFTTDFVTEAPELLDARIYFDRCDAAPDLDALLSRHLTRLHTNADTAAFAPVPDTTAVTTHYWHYAQAFRAYTQKIGLHVPITPPQG